MLCTNVSFKFMVKIDLKKKIKFSPSSRELAVLFIMHTKFWSNWMIFSSVIFIVWLVGFFFILFINIFIVKCWKGYLNIYILYCTSHITLKFYVQNCILLSHRLKLIIQTDFDKIKTILHKHLDNTIYLY